MSAFVVIAGMSGAGRSHAANNLEDLGWFVMDNLPPSLVPKVAELAGPPGTGIDRLALVVGTGRYHDEIVGMIDDLRSGIAGLRILFLDAATDALVRRYESTRRRHPFSESASSQSASSESASSQSASSESASSQSASSESASSQSASSESASSQSASSQSASSQSASSQSASSQSASSQSASSESASSESASSELTTLAAAIEAERAVLEPVRAVADVVVDTTDLNVHQLRDRIVELFDTGGDRSMRVTVVSFGYSHGIPRDVDMLIDCRFLPNPHWVEELRPLTGLDEPVAGYLMAQPVTAEFLDRLESLLALLVPQYVAEGKSYLTVAFGCTGGRHRSVAVAEHFVAMLRTLGHEPAVLHRDIGK